MDTTSSSEELQHRSLNENQCILLCGVPCTAGDSLDKITLEKWESIREKSLRWKGLHRYQDVYENVDWEKGPKGHYMHNNCYTCLSSKRWLTQAENRKRKLTEERDETCQKDRSPETSFSSPKKLRSSLGILHNKSVCVWCMKGQFKSSDREKQLLLLPTKDAWTRFKLHTVRLEDKVLRSRLDTLITSIPHCETAFGLVMYMHTIL